MKTLINWLIAAVIISSGQAIASGIGGGASGVVPSGTPSIFDGGTSTAITINSEGKIGFGTDSFVNNNESIIQSLSVGPNSIITGNKAASGSGWFDFYHNAYYDQTSFTYKYIDDGPASWFELSSGGFYLKSAVSGTATNNITWANALTADDAGYVGVNTTTPDTQFHVNGAAHITGLSTLAGVVADDIENTSVFIDDNTPELVFDEADQTGANQNWGFRSSGSQFSLNTFTSGRVVSSPMMTFTRSGVSPVQAITHGTAYFQDTVTLTDTLLSTKACAAGYTRMSPNYCKLNSMVGTGTVLVSATCTTVAAASADATFVQLRIHSLVRPDGTGGNKYTETGAFTTSSCTTRRDFARLSAYEETAGSPTNILAEDTQIILAPSNGTNYFLKQTEDAGGWPEARFLVMGYYD